MNVYAVQPENNAPDVMIPDSDEKRALTRRKMIPKTANSAEKKRGCLGLEPTKAF